jgi:Tol biopolymer transport system component
LAAERSHPPAETREFRRKPAAWSPGGRSIAVERSGILIGAAGRTLRRLTAQHDNDPAWAPNGRKIIFDRRIARGSESSSSLVRPAGQPHSLTH